MATFINSMFYIAANIFTAKTFFFALIMSVLIHFLSQDQVKTHISNITHTIA